MGYNASLIDQINTFRTLRDGWDGEGAAAPQPASISDAVTLLSAVSAPDADVSLHADGTVIVEGRGQSFRFLGHGRISVAAKTL